MKTNRLEAFSDGVIAIIVTIMVLEMKVPHGQGTLDELLPLWPVFLSYVLSFVNVALYWSNHHHLMFATEHVDGAILWANNHLLFWLSLVPFTTGWMGQNHFAAMPMALYGANLLMCAVAWAVLQSTIIASHGPESNVARAIGRDWKGKLPLLAYAAGVALAFLSPWISAALYVGVAMLWLIPDRRIAKVLTE